MFSGVSTAQVVDDSSPALRESSETRADRSEENKDKLRFAASQHEIISILIDEADFDGIIPEFDKILELGFTGDDERLVVKEALIISDRLMRLGQFPVAHEIIDETLEVTHQRDNQFSLLMMKGKIFKEQGQIRRALRAYKQAQRIQR
jgi:hypothetical protein